MKIIAHRCGSDLYPELTLESARHSLSSGADMVEMDIRLTADQVPVICHDADGRRLFGADGRIDEMTFDAYQALSRVEGQPYHPISLEEILASDIGPILFHMKIKREPLLVVLERLSKEKEYERFMLGVSTTEDVAQAKRLCPRMRTLAFMKEKSAMDAFIEAGVDVVRLWSDWVDAPSVERIHQAGRQVFVMAGRAHDGSVGLVTEAEVLAWQSLGCDGVLVNEVCPVHSVLR